MGALTHEFLRNFLSIAFNADPEFVVPKQGNWWNPQDNSSNEQKVQNWCAFKIAKTKTVVVPFYQQIDNGLLAPTNVSTTYMISLIDVQLVGSLAEQNAISVSHWIHRNDLTTMLDNNNCQFLATGLGNYIVSNFAQDGFNTVFAYNVQFEVQWASTIDTTQEILDTVNILGGTVVVSS